MLPTSGGGRVDLQSVEGISGLPSAHAVRHGVIHANFIGLPPTSLTRINLKRI
jgi:hypothetical protein